VRCRSIGAAHNCASKTETMVRRRVSCQEARVSDIGAPLPSNTQCHRLRCLGRFNPQPTPASSKQERGVLAQLARDLRSTTSTIWKTMSPLLGRNRNVAGATSHTADGFAVFFDRKIERVRFDTAGRSPPPSARSSFTSFRSCSPEEVRKIIMSSSIKSCSLDPVYYSIFICSYYRSS